MLIEGGDYGGWWGQGRAWSRRFATADQTQTSGRDGCYAGSNTWHYTVHLGARGDGRVVVIAVAAHGVRIGVATRGLYGGLGFGERGWGSACKQRTFGAKSRLLLREEQTCKANVYK